MSATTFWLTALLLAAGTFFIRVSFLHALDRHPAPERLRRALRFIPAAVLPAIVAPALACQGGGLAGPGSPRLLAGLIALAVAWRTRNMFVPIAVGMAAMWALQALPGLGLATGVAP